MIQKYVDEHVLISEAEIEDGMFYVFDRHRLIIEGAAAVGVGALLHRKLEVRGKRVVALLSGSSIDSLSYARILQSRLANGAKGDRP
jgi:threonine dehydratase